MFNLIDTPIQTELSYLKIYEFSNPELIREAINETKDKLNTSSNRRVGFFSDAYKGFYYYGKIKITESQPLTTSIASLIDIANNQFETDYNGIIINEYETGANFIEKHSDSKNHPDIGVIILSHGVTRNFRVFNKKNNKKILDVPLIENQAIHMGGCFQTEFTHDVQQDLSIKEARYSISYHKYMNLGRYQ
jgi:alkylated DNA repair dioxygenase AlkB